MELSSEIFRRLGGNGAVMVVTGAALEDATVPATW
jgi:hypothetical protein